MYWVVLLVLAGCGGTRLRFAGAVVCNFKTKLTTEKNLTIDSAKESIRSRSNGFICVSVDFSHNNLSFLPADFFEFPLATAILSLNLSRNNLSSLESVNFTYLTQLEKLDFSHNALQVLKNGTFSDACCLESLDLSHNEIVRIEVGAFQRGMYTVKMVDLSYNLLTSYEQWQYLFSTSVHMDLSHNRICSFTNELGITFTQNQFHNVVNLTYNNITTLEAKDFVIYHNGVPPSATQLASYGLFIENNPFVCDCRLHWLVSLIGKSLLVKHERIDTLFVCTQPAELKGKSFGFLIRTPDILICNVSRDCPVGCTCQERPHRGYTQVDCDPTRHLYTRLPAMLPSAPLLYLNMSGHQVHKLDIGLDYLSRLYGLNVADNRLTEVTSSFMAATSSLVTLDVRRNHLTSLPGEARRLPVQYLKVTGNPFKCSCDFIWIGEWVRTVIGNVSSTEAPQPSSPEEDPHIALLFHNTAPDFPPEVLHDVPLDEQLRHDLSSLTCRRREGQTMALTEMSVASLGCGRLAEGGIAGGCVMMLLLCAAVVCWRRQYETKILFFWVYRHCKEACCRKPIAVPTDHDKVRTERDAADKHYDVFVSVDEDDEVALTWVRKVLLPLLEERDLPLYVYLPARQELPGECKAEARANGILESRNTLVLITPGYSRNAWCRYEFDHACRHLEEHDAGKLVLLRMADKDDEDDDDNEEILIENGEDNDEEDGRKARRCPDCVRAGGRQKAVVDNGCIRYGDDAEEIRKHDNHGEGDSVGAPNGDVSRRKAGDFGDDCVAGDKPKYDHRELVTAPENRAGGKLCGAWCGHGRAGFYLPRLWRRQQRPDEKSTEPRRQRAHKLARYCESGEHMIAVEPLNTYIAEGRFWHIRDRLLKQKLLYELSVFKK